VSFLTCRVNPISPVTPDFNRPSVVPPRPQSAENHQHEQTQVSRFEELMSKPKVSRQTAEAVGTPPNAPRSPVAPLSGRHGRGDNHDGNDSLTGGVPLRLDDTEAAPPPASGEPIAVQGFRDQQSSGGNVQEVLESPSGVSGDDLSPVHTSRDDDEGDPQGQGRETMTAPALQHPVFQKDSVSTISPTEVVTRISELSALIADAASNVTFESSGTATIELSQTQLPDSKVVIRMQENVIQVIFRSDNASSIALLQARGAEVAGALAIRFDREITVELVEGDGPDDRGTSLETWAVSRRDHAQGDAGSGTPS